MDIITREEAKERGLKRYFTGKPCKYGHIAERFTINERCLDCTKKYYGNTVFSPTPDNQLILQWCRENTYRYWKWYTPPLYQIKKENIHKILESEEHARAIRQHKKEYEKQWRDKNRDVKRQICLRYRVRKFNADGDYEIEDWLYLCDYFDYRCLSCGEQKPLSIDHIQPLSKGGSNYIENLQPLCRSCNSSKNDNYINFIEGMEFNFPSQAERQRSF